MTLIYLERCSLDLGIAVPYRWHFDICVLLHANDCLISCSHYTQVTRLPDSGAFLWQKDPVGGSSLAATIASRAATIASIVATTARLVATIASLAAITISLAATTTSLVATSTSLVATTSSLVATTIMIATTTTIFATTATIRATATTILATTTIIVHITGKCNLNESSNLLLWFYVETRC